jgi:regulatory protein
MAWAIFTLEGKSVNAGRKSQPTLKHRALWRLVLRMLARREHSREELRRKLERLAGEGDDVAAILDDLAARGWLSDARYAELSIRAHSGRFGPRKLTQQLRSRGVADETIAAGFAAAGVEGVSDIERVWGSRFRAPPADDRERGRQVRFLQGRGFALETALRYLKSLESSR